MFSADLSDLAAPKMTVKKDIARSIENGINLTMRGYALMHQIFDSDGNLYAQKDWSVNLKDPCDASVMTVTVTPV